MLYATDTVSLGDIRVGDSGYLEAFARTARTGVQQYLGAEMGRPDLGVVNVYRDAAEVFSHTSLHSFAKIPVTVDHPPAGVTAQNWKAVAVGTTGEEVLRDGERLKIGLKIMDASAIAAIQAGKRELSVGYRTEIVWGDGTAPDGTPYQAKQTAIHADHVAIVSAGRAGASCRIGDSWTALDAGGPRDPSRSDPRTPPPTTRDTAMKTHLIGDNAVEMSDAAIVAVKGLQTEMGRLTADNLKLTGDINLAADAHTKAITAKDGEILKLQADHKVAVDAKDAEIAKLKGESITADKLDAAVAERSAVVDAAKPILGATFDAKGKTVSDIRRAAVAKRLGDKAVEGKADEHVTIAFDTLTAAGPGNGDPLGRAIADSIPTRDRNQISDPHARRVAAMQDAWKQAPAA